MDLLSSFVIVVKTEVARRTYNAKSYYQSASAEALKHITTIKSLPQALGVRAFAPDHLHNL